MRPSEKRFAKLQSRHASSALIYMFTGVPSGTDNLLFTMMRSEDIAEWLR